MYGKLALTILKDVAIAGVLTIASAFLMGLAKDQSRNSINEIIMNINNRFT